MNLNFKISELVKSNTALAYNINNIPDVESLDNLLNLIYFCLQPIRNIIQRPMIITSGYRNARVNQLVGGVADSQHCLGQAVDFKINSMTPALIIEKIKKSNIEFDQLINEYGKWVHISYCKGRNRKQILSIK